MKFIVAKENPKSPEGWDYFRNYENQDDIEYPSTTLFVESAKIFSTREEAAMAYWKLCKFIYGYKIYNFDTTIKDKSNVS